MIIYFVLTVFFIVLSSIFCGISMLRRDDNAAVIARYALWFLIFAVINIAFAVFAR